MSQTVLSLRERVLFPKDNRGFHDNCSKVRNELKLEFDKTPADSRNAVASLLTELTIDLGSYLVRWCLLKQSPESCIRQIDIDDEIEKNCHMLLTWNLYDTVNNVRAEIARIRSSNLVRISELSDQGVLNTRWGHDSVVGLSRAVRRGAVLVTTNPVMVNSVRKEDPETWNDVKDRIWASNPDREPQEIASLITMEVILRNCIEMRPIFEATQGRYGYVCLQINPRNCTDSVKMAEEVEMLYGRLKDELGGTPNAAFKVPGTKAGLKTAERLTKQGICVNITASASVAQLVEFARVIEGGQAKISYLTIMSGRLDDPIREELKERGLEDFAEVATWASAAVTKKAYDLVFGKLGLKKSTFLPASIRGPWNIDRCINSGNTEIIITVFPDKAVLYDTEPKKVEAHLHDLIPTDIMQKLRRSSIFQKAYDESPLSPEEYDSFYPVEATLKQFSANYQEFLEYVGKASRPSAR